METTPIRREGNAIRIWESPTYMRNLYTVSEWREISKIGTRLADEIEAENEPIEIKDSIKRNAFGNLVLTIRDGDRDIPIEYTTEQWWQLSEQGNDIAKEIDYEQAEAEKKEVPQGLWRSQRD